MAKTRYPTPPPLTPDQQRDQEERFRVLNERFERLGDASIDFSDLPERTAAELATARRIGRPPRHVDGSKPVTLRLDADVLRWFKAQGAGYQTRINAALRAAIDLDRILHA